MAEIRVKKAIGTPTKTVSQIELTKGLALPEKVKARIHRDVGDFLVESVLSEVGKERSPVAGESWPSLSPKYKAQKKADGLPAKANLEFEGDLLDSLTHEATDHGIELGFFDSEAWKADGHLKFSGKENATPKRRFLPDEGQKFTPSIQQEVEKIVADAIADEIDLKAADLENVSTTTELYDALKEQFPGLSRAEIRTLISRTPRLAQLLDDEDLLDLL